jgi:hypothetical protein
MFAIDLLKKDVPLLAANYNHFLNPQYGAASTVVG